MKELTCMALVFVLGAFAVAGLIATAPHAMTAATAPLMNGFFAGFADGRK